MGWLKNLLGWESPEEAAALQPNWTRIGAFQQPFIIQPQVQPRTFVDEMKDCFNEAVQQMERERLEAETKLFDSGRLPEYIKSTIRYAAKEFSKTPYTFCMMTAKNVGVPMDQWVQFVGIFVKLAKEVGFQATTAAAGFEYLVIQRAQFEAAMRMVPPPNVPTVDDRLRETLQTGPYR